MKSTFILVLLFLSHYAHAQIAKAYLDINNVKALVYADGTMFWEADGDRRSSFEVPKGSGKATLFSSQLWLGGMDEEIKLHTAGQTYRLTPSGGPQTNCTDFWVGPLNRDGSAPNPADWNRIWKVNKSTIDNHKLNYKTPGYVVPEELQEWPGNGTGELNSIIAPFADLDGDAKYEPADGDYPYVRGDQTVFFIINDGYGSHTHYTGGLPLRVEIQGMLYAFNSSNEVLKNTVFLNYKVISRSLVAYDQVYWGMWTDFDIGNPNDDYCGTDVARNMMYSYNGDLNDENGEAPGYGANPPAQGLQFLSHPLSSSLYFTRLTQAHVNGEPENAVELYRYLKGRWADGSQVTYDSTGKGGTQQSKHVFDGDPCLAQGWKEPNPPMSAGDRKMVGSHGPLLLNPQTYLNIDVAYIYTRDVNEGKSVCMLQDAADYIAALYSAGQVTGIANTKKEELIISPNPLQNSSVIKFSNADRRKFILSVYDVRGVLMRQQEAITSSEVTIEKGDLLPGVYYISLSSDNANYHSKLIVE